MAEDAEHELVHEEIAREPGVPPAPTSPQPDPLPPQSDRPQSDRPQSDRPQSDRPQSERPQSERPVRPNPYADGSAAESPTYTAPSYAVPPPTAPPASASYTPETRSPNHKSPALAAFLAFFPGMGHIYNGLYQRGAVLFLIFAGCIAMVNETGSPIFGFAIAFVWMFNVLDAYRQANLINHGYATDLGMLDAAKAGKSGNGTMIAGALIFLVGLFELLDEYNLFDWDLIWRNWSVLLMLGGVWMVISALRERGRADLVD